MTPPLRFEGAEHGPQGAFSPARWSFRVSEGSLTAAAVSASTADTVARLCVGSLSPTRGRVVVLDVEPARLGRTGLLRFRRRLGVCFRREGLVSTISLRENIVLPMVWAREISRREARERTSAAIRDLDLHRWADRRPQDVPREVRIVTALARAACPRPELLILEAPVADLPSRHAEETLGWCRERSPTIFVLAPDRTGPVSKLADQWVSLAEAPRTPVDDSLHDSAGTE